mmetsp:Transcript_25978/g.55284  ORF Transcript_25978/g.55284 Transcript_25978/m.55284 type:complete len:238 (-) Transcript_25978:137-850(-)
MQHALRNDITVLLLRVRLTAAIFLLLVHLLARREPGSLPPLLLADPVPVHHSQPHPLPLPHHARRADGTPPPHRPLQVVVVLDGPRPYLLPQPSPEALLGDGKELGGHVDGPLPLGAVPPHGLVVAVLGREESNPRGVDALGVPGIVVHEGADLPLRVVEVPFGEELELLLDPLHLIIVSFLQRQGQGRLARAHEKRRSSAMAAAPHSRRRGRGQYSRRTGPRRERRRERLHDAPRG